VGRPSAIRGSVAAPPARRRAALAVQLAGLLAMLLGGLLLPGAAHGAGEPWEDEEAFQVLRREELKVLRDLMERALAKDYRRQAWYVADRIAQVDPTAEDAIAVLERWDGAALQEGQTPNAAFVKRREKALAELGDAYFHFGETLEASGMDPETYYPINVRAHAYGSRAGPLVAALSKAGYRWLGVYGPKPQAEVEELLHGSVDAFSFPEEFDDDYLKARAVWPAARGAGWDAWRLLTDHDYKEALRLLGMVAAAERWMLEHVAGRFGGKRRKDEGVVDLYVFSQWQDYDRIGEEILPERDREPFRGTSGWQDPRSRRVLVTWRHRHNPWLGDDDLLLGHAAEAMARRHLGGSPVGLVQGRGAWLLDGLRGAFEGFHLDEDGKGQIDAQACWRLFVARKLREDGALLPWPEFMDIDREKARAMARPTLKVSFGGQAREAKEADRVAAQATALVVGILMADRGKHREKFGKLVGDLYKRDSLPDVDKALGLRPGTAVSWADTAMDAAR
jgi:hypothetical protein